MIWKRNWPALILVLTIAALLVSSCGAGNPEAGEASSEPATGYLANQSLFCGEPMAGLDRYYDLYVPASYKADKSYALVINMHGFTGTQGRADPGGQDWLSHMTDIAEKEGFIVAMPAGIGRAWNSGACCGRAVEWQVDDVAFVSSLIDTVSGQYSVDAGRVYAMGMSNGGRMAYRLACELGDRIAAIGSVGGALGMSDCALTRPVPAVHFHGTEDPIAPMEGTDVMGNPMNLRGMIDDWAARNGCAGETEVVHQEGEVTCVAHTECDDDATVILCTVEGGGHSWPGGSALPEMYGYVTDDIDASAYIWEFFAEHPMN